MNGLVACVIIVGFKVGSVTLLNKATVEGKILRESANAYIVDFSKDMKRQHFLNPLEYKKKIVPKTDCVKE